MADKKIDVFSDESELEKQKDDNESQEVAHLQDSVEKMDISNEDEASESFLGDEFPVDSDEFDKTKTVEEAEAEAKIDESLDEIYKSDPEVDKVVDDIVRAESDEVIAESDAKLAALNETKKKVGLRRRIGSFFRSWWQNRPARYGTLAGLFIIVVTLALLPSSRYTMLNALGVRVSSSMTVVDSQTRLPLRDIQVQLQDKTLRTDQEGFVEFRDIKLGKSNLVITKRGYADIQKEMVLGWGSNPLGEQSLVATGEQFTFVLRDWKSDAVITNAEAVAGENNARADENGKIVLTVGEEDIANVSVVITAENYRPETLEGSQLDDSERKLQLVPRKKHVFVSNRDGKYDIYTIDADKKNEKLLLEATEKERDVPAVLIHPSKNLAAIVSSRDGEENKDGFVLEGLFIVNLETGETKKLTRSEQLRFVGWAGDRLIYSQVSEGTSQANPERSKLQSYHVETEERVELASANYFNDVKLIDQTVYYAVSSFAVPQSRAKLFSVLVDGTDRQTELDNQVWNIYRTEYDTLIFSAADRKWYEKKGENTIEEVDSRRVTSLQFSNSPAGERTAWVEVRDGKGVLLLSPIDELNDEQLLSLAGLTEVLYWLNETTLIIRIISATETADYLVYVDAETPVAEKLTDVTTTQRLYY